MLGAVAMHAKDIASGREPRDMGGPDDLETMGKFWRAALVQGGGLGIMGDFFFADQNRFGRGATETFMGGPTFQIVDDFTRLTVGNAQQLVTGKDTDFPVEFLRFLESNSPSIWQVQPIKNAMFDQMELMVDPSIQKKMNQSRRKRMREYNQEYWWAPGEPLPEFAQ